MQKMQEDMDKFSEISIDMVKEMEKSAKEQGKVSDNLYDNLPPVKEKIEYVERENDPELVEMMMEKEKEWETKLKLNNVTHELKLDY